jgi:MFS family permease
MEENMQTMKETGIVAGKERNGYKKRMPVLINRNFALLWSGQAISIPGDFVFNTTLVVWIAVELAKGQSWSPLAVSGVFLASSIPTFLFGPVAGVFVDRWDRRHTMMVADAIRAIFIGLLLVVETIASAFRGEQIALFWQLGIIYGVVFLVNLCDQFFRPSMMALIRDIVEEPLQPQAMGLGQISVSLATIVGPALAPPLLLLFGVQWALLINACSFFVSFMTLLAIRSPRFAGVEKVGQSDIQDFLEGMRFLIETPVLVSLLTSNVIAMLGGGALYALDIFFVTQNLHTPAALYGLLETAMGAGTIVGAILASMFAQRLGLARTIWSSMLTLGVLILVYARLSSFAPAVVLLFITGIPLAALNVAGGPLLLRATPRELIGRVSSLFNPLSTAASIVGAGLAGYLASSILQSFHLTLLDLSFGPVDTIFSGAGLLILLGGLAAMLQMRSDRVKQDSHEK